MSSILGRAAEEVVVEEGDYAEEQLLPAGLYSAVIVDITEGRHEERGEDWVKLNFEVTAGPYTGAKIADWWGYGYNEVKEQISDKKFKTLMTLCKVDGALQSYDQLCMIPVGINNKPYRGKSDGVMHNSINYYRTAPAANPQQASAPALAPVQQAAPQPMQPAQPMQQVQQMQMAQQVPSIRQVAPQSVVGAPMAQPAPAPAPQAAPAPFAAQPVQAPAPMQYAQQQPAQAYQAAGPDVGDGDNVPF